MTTTAMTAQRPRRVQLSRTKGWRMPPNTVSVARPTRWGNPWHVGDPIEVRYIAAVVGSPGFYRSGDHRLDDSGMEQTITAELAVWLYRQALLDALDAPASSHPDDQAIWQELHDALAALAGHDLACWCPLEDEHGNRVPCHADVLLSLANRTVSDD